MAAQAFVWLFGAWHKLSSSLSKDHRKRELTTYKEECTAPLLRAIVLLTGGRPSGREAHSEKLEPTPSGHIRALIHAQHEPCPVCLWSGPHTVSSYLLPPTLKLQVIRTETKNSTAFTKQSRKCSLNQDCGFPGLFPPSCLVKCKRYKLCSLILGQIIHGPLGHPGLEWTRTALPETQLIMKNILKTA